MAASPAIFTQGKYGPSEPAAAKHRTARAQTANRFVKAQIREQKAKITKNTDRRFVTVQIRPEDGGAVDAL